jgi:deoxycytidylate deaminase
VTAPPDFAIEHALMAARLSPCAKSKRGAAVFRDSPVVASRPDRDPFTIAEVVDVIAVGMNGQPDMRCSGDDACRAVCGRRCVHAEGRAIRHAVQVVAAKVGLVGLQPLRGWDLVHVKVVDGELVAGGGPSCWQCSREVLDVGLDAVWLFEERPSPAGDGSWARMWIRYDAPAFHRVTWQTIEEDARERRGREVDAP